MGAKRKGEWCMRGISALLVAVLVLVAVYVKLMEEGQTALAGGGDVKVILFALVAFVLLVALRKWLEKKQKK